LEPPDIQEKGIRFGCGFVVGLLLTASYAISLSVTNGYYSVAVLIVGGVICGLLAMKYGDRFWDGFRGWVSRWWWW
jgi:hypothetical protein